MEDIKKNDAAAILPQSEKEALKAKYGKVYRVSCSVREDEATISRGPACPLMTAT